MGKKKHIVNMLFTVLLLGVFALAAIFVAVIGAEVYQSSSIKMQANFDTRTSLVYIAEKVRQSASTDFDVREVAGNDALVITEIYDDEREYETWIYVADGKLNEATVTKGTEVDRRKGQSIMDMNSMDFEVSGNLVTITIENTNGETESLTVGRRG